MREPQSGDVYVVTERFATVGTNLDKLSPYEIGDKLELIEPTGRNPFYRDTPHTLWMVKCKHFCPPNNNSIWAYIPGFIAAGYIELEVL